MDEGIPSLRSMLAQVPDPRGARGRRYPWPSPSAASTGPSADFEADLALGATVDAAFTRVHLPIYPAVRSSACGGVRMWFTDPTAPSTLVALLIEAALVGLAVAVASFGVLVRPARRLALGLAALGVIVGLGGVASAVWEARTFRYPLVLPGAPAGTYAQPTLLMLLGVLLNGLLVAVAGVLAFRRPGVAGLLFIAAGGQTLASVLRSRAQDPTFPPGNVSSAIVAVVLPSLALGALLLATRWAEHRKDRRSGGASGVESRSLSAPR